MLAWSRGRAARGCYALAPGVSAWVNGLFAAGTAARKLPLALFVFLLTVLISAGLGVIPAFQASRLHPAEALREV